MNSSAEKLLAKQMKIEANLLKGITLPNMAGMTTWKYDKLYAASKTWELPGIKAMQESISQLNESLKPFYNSKELFVGNFTAALENYTSFSQLVSASKQMSILAQPLFLNMDFAKTITPTMKYLTSLSEFSMKEFYNSSFMEHLNELIDFSIDTSIFDYWSQKEEQEIVQLNITPEIEADIFELSQNPSNQGILKKLWTQYGDKGKAIILTIVTFFICEFFGGLFNAWAEPIYEAITPIQLQRYEESNEPEISEIPAHTRIHTWSNRSEDLIEVTYICGDIEYQGYITKHDLENNSKKISEGMDWEHMSFISDTVELLSFHWNIEEENVYHFITEDTNLMDEYIWKNYEALYCLEDNTLIDAIESYCEGNGIIIPRNSGE